MYDAHPSVLVSRFRPLDCYPEARGGGGWRVAGFRSFDDLPKLTPKLALLWGVGWGCLHQCESSHI
jgi:hypothetical protein